ncbi:UvrD-like helicase, ATP-binding domain, P-loop containing nucleoside triphosphate hydrolase [Tanacetum coccineum]|uniref:UvrD-like helicase, ATP-binding domain, P-loop containing nucleoside triphosphate hydrolase n=1 Tax=Tanacetum coccineum TaxID=301880 RepID=A0ABQ5GUD4_9ASTR
MFQEGLLLPYCCTDILSLFLSLCFSSLSWPLKMRVLVWINSMCRDGDKILGTMDFIVQLNSQRDIIQRVFTPLWLSRTILNQLHVYGSWGVCFTHGAWSTTRYVVGLVVALAVGVITHTPQPKLIWYLISYAWQDEYEEWKAKLLMEESSAIKFPSISYHLTSTKKVQHELVKPNLQDDTEAVKNAVEQPEAYVMKPQRKGGKEGKVGKPLWLVSNFPAAHKIASPPSLIGGLRAGECSDGRLSYEGYSLLPKSRSSTLIKENREIVYKLFQAYEKMKTACGEFDLGDFVNDIHCRLKNGKYGGDQMDFVYIDKEFLSSRSSGKREKSLLSEISQLKQNFRTHAGVLDLAQSVIDILYYYFVHSIDNLAPETSLISGESPVLLESSNDKNAIVTIFGGSESSGEVVGFGAEQVILVRDERAKTEICEYV